MYDWNPSVDTTYTAYEQVSSEDGTSDWYRIDWNGRTAYVSTRSASGVGESSTVPLDGSTYGSAWLATPNQRLATRSGPGPGYMDMGTWYLTGQPVHVLAKSWDNTNQIWWVQFLEPESEQRLWTGSKRFD